MEKILSIKEESFKLNEKDWNEYDGFIIETTEQLIKIGVSNSQSCCENWGDLITNDSADEFIGSELLSVAIVDTALNNKKIEQLEYLDEGDAMFVNLETSEGLLQFVVYNSHNGYYGHNAVLISKQLTEERYL